MSENIFYTSQTPISIYQHCPRQRYLNYHFQGRGIVPVSKSVPLTTGGCVHKGVEYLLRQVKEGNYESNKDGYVEDSVSIAVTEYERLLSEGDFLLQSTEEEMAYRVLEQKALTEALVRVWAKIELPQLTKRFQIVNVEREIQVPLEYGIVLQVRIDAELRDKENGQLYIYSLKTLKAFDEREEKSYPKALQCITEIYGLEYWLKESNQLILDSIEASKAMLANPSLPDRLRQAHTKLIPISESQLLPSRVQGVRFCFLQKGKMYKGSGEFYKQSSPLIKGYKQFSANNVRYAHSYYFPNPSNKSGQGSLGSKWDSFNVWEEGDLGQVGIGGVKEWIDMLASGQVQPECGDILRQQVVTPPEYFRDKEEIEETLEEVTYQERFIMANILSMKDSPLDFNNVQHRIFRKTRSACHYPVDCDYLPICFPKGRDHDISRDPIGSGAYRWREPHHEGERVEHERLYSISQQVKETT